MADGRIGTEFGGYQVESVLGRGGMGVVYLAEDPRLGRKVALKLLSPDLSQDERFRDRFIKESRMAAGLEHPSIVPVYEAGEHEGQLYIAMRYIPGADLGSLIERDGPLPPERVATIVEQVADALDSAHDRGLIHRDVKPANILVEPGRRDRAYLSDFGVTKRVTSKSGLTQTGQFMGTVDYVAPEQIEGQDVDGRADQYSLACVAFEGLTGRPPFNKDSEVATIYAHLQEPPPKPSAVRPGLPTAIDGVLAKGMAKGREDRFETCASLAEAVSKATGAAQITGPGAAPSRRVVRLVAVALVVVVAAVAAFLVATRNSGRSASPDGGVQSSPALGTAAGLTRIDPKTNKISKTFNVNAVAVALSPDAVWALLPAHVLKINPRTNAIVADIPIKARNGGLFLLTPSNLAEGDGSVWVSAAPSVVRIDEATNAVTAELPSAVVGCVGCPAGQPDPNGVGVGLGAVWILNPSAGVVTKLDPRTNEKAATIRINNASSIAVGEGAVWVTNGITDAVFRIDPGTAKIVKAIALPGAANAVAVGEGSVWVSNSGNGTVVEIDPDTNLGVSTIAVGHNPQGLAVGAGAVWVTNTGDGTLSRIDPATKKVTDVIPIGFCSIGGPAGVVANDDGVWVVNKCR